MTTIGHALVGCKPPPGGNWILRRFTPWHLCIPGVPALRKNEAIKYVGSVKVENGGTPTKPKKFLPIYLFF